MELRFVFAFLFVFACCLAAVFFRGDLHESPLISIIVKFGASWRKQSFDHQNLTVVSAYFNLGSFQKGSQARFTPVLYLKWAESLTRLQNPLVFYTDDLDFKNIIEHGRKPLESKTHVIFITNKESLWAFSFKDEIKKIYNDPKYPKYYPGTVSAEYVCAQHAKYELINMTLNRKLSKADYYAWVDVGYFRGISREKFRFRLAVPTDFRNDKIAYTQIRQAYMDKTIKEVIRGNKLWVGGGMFIGREKTLRAFVLQYQKAVRKFLQDKLMNTDQQIIYAMFTTSGRTAIQPTVEPQVYIPSGNGNPWFYLGYLCMRKINDTI